MNNTPLYDITLKFESELFVSALGEDVENTMLSMFREKSGIGSRCVATHNVNIANTPAVPADEEIEKMRQTIFEEVSKAFANKSNVDVKNTKFVGITSIKRKN